MSSLLTAFVGRPYSEHKTLEIGASAPDFHLTGVDEKTYSLSSFKDAQILVVIFTCNHCPTAQAYEDRIVKLTSDYFNKKVAVVAIMPNDPNSMRLDELDFSDIGDSYAEMKIRAKEKKFNFPYLYDGTKQTVSNAYGPVATPHVFVFDNDRKLRYQGRVDDMENPYKSPKNTDARNAIEALLQNREVPVKTTKVFGCSVKWAEKKDLVEKVREKWAKGPVNIEPIDEDGIKNLIKNSSKKLRLINLWSLESSACTEEFPDFVTMNRMYRDRDFEFISINIDGLGNRYKTLRFLQNQQASNSNFLFNRNDKIESIKGADPSWRGSLPYTVLVEPGGKIVYSKEGIIDPGKLKKAIVNNHLMGRFP